MPIYVYEFEGSDGPARIEVFQHKQENEFKTMDDIDPDQVIGGDTDQFFKTMNDILVKRVSTSPGAFQGLPTPKFFRDRS